MSGSKFQHGLSTNATRPTSDQVVTGTLTAASANVTTSTVTTSTVTTANITNANITNLTTSSANTGIGGQVIVRTSAAVTVNASAVYVNVTGLSQTVVPGTYRFSCRLPSTVASGTGGIKYAFNYTTTVLSSIEATSVGYAAAALATQHTTTITNQADLFSQAAVVLFVDIEGTFVVTTGGTIAVQVAQNTSNGSNTVALVGGTFELDRIS